MRSHTTAVKGFSGGMRALSLILPLISSVTAAPGAMARPPGHARPSSYRVTIIYRSRPGVIHDPNLQMYPPYPVYPGLSHLRVQVSWQAGRWRESDRWLIPPPAGTSSLARVSTAPLPNTTASDGHRMWLIDPRRRTVTVYPPDPAGTWPETEGLLKEFAGDASPADILSSRCYPATHYRDARIAGRAVSVIGIGQDRCPVPGGRESAHQSRLLDGRRVVWVDKGTFFTLRSDQYAFNQPHHLILRTDVTAIRYNARLSPSLFRLTVPRGYRLIHGR